MSSVERRFEFELSSVMSTLAYRMVPTSTEANVSNQRLEKIDSFFTLNSPSPDRWLYFLCESVAL